ncbi:MAG: DEAD-box ATP-dependent RNA helicase DeaD (CshA), partial [uncultured Solirubrobacteraceae bacterium]
DDLRRSRPLRPRPAGARRRRLRHPEPHPGAGHPGPARGPRRDRAGPDRHRQDGRLRPADDRGRRPVGSGGAGARPDADARAVHPGHAGDPRLRRAQGHRPGRGLRRGADPRAAGPPQERRSRGGRHRRPRPRPDLAPLPDPALLPLRGPRRGRRDARPGLPRGRREDPRAHPGQPSDRAVQRHHGARDPRARRAPPLRARAGQGQGRDADHRHRRAVLPGDAVVGEGRGAGARAEGRAAGAGPGLRAHQGPLRPAPAPPQRSRPQRPGAARRHVAGRSRRGDDRLQERSPADPRGHRRGRPRPRHLLGDPRRQLRHPDVARRLRAPHRAHGPRRRVGPGHHLRRAAAEGGSGGDREARQHPHLAVGRGRPRGPHAGRGAALAPPSKAPRRAAGARAGGLRQAVDRRRALRGAARGRRHPRHHRGRAPRRRGDPQRARARALRPGRGPAGPGRRHRRRAGGPAGPRSRPARRAGPHL